MVVNCQHREFGDAVPKRALGDAVNPATVQHQCAIVVFSADVGGRDARSILQQELRRPHSHGRERNNRLPALRLEETRHRHTRTRGIAIRAHVRRNQHTRKRLQRLGNTL